MPKRKRLIALLLALALTCLLCANLIALNKDFLIVEGRNLPFGSRLISHATMPPKSTYPRVLLVGNSVFQYTQLVTELRRQRNALGETGLFELGNFGAVGASVADYLFIYRFIRRFAPDLVVFQLNPHNFASSEPLLRTDMKGLIFDADYRTLWRLAPIRAAYTRNELAESLLYTYFPVYRMLPLARDAFKNWVYGSGLRIMDFFPWRLNRAEEWRTAQAPGRMKSLSEKAEPHSASGELLDELVAQLRADGQRALFVIQERPTPVYPAEQKLCKEMHGNANLHCADFSSYFRAEEYSDHVHPNPTGARTSAARLLIEIESALGRPQSQGGKR